MMIGFRIQGFDILPDIIGYLFFASAFNSLASSSTYFDTAKKYNIFMIILSIFSIYQVPAQSGEIYFGSLGILSIPVGITALILNLVVVYYLFMGLKDMAEKREQTELAKESDEKWNQYKILQIASLLSFALIFIPVLGIVYIIGLFVMSIIIAIKILGFLKRYKERFNTLV